MQNFKTNLCTYFSPASYLLVPGRHAENENEEKIWVKILKILQFVPQTASSIIASRSQLLLCYIIISIEKTLGSVYSSWSRYFCQNRICSIWKQSLFYRAQKSLDPKIVFSPVSCIGDWFDYTLLIGSCCRCRVVWYLPRGRGAVGNDVGLFRLVIILMLIVNLHHIVNIIVGVVNSYTENRESLLSSNAHAQAAPRSTWLNK